MPSSPHRNFFRVLLIRGDGRELLLEATSALFRLPRVGIPAYSRPAEELAEAVATLFNLGVCCLLILPPGSGDQISSAVLEICEERNQVPPNFAWKIIKDIRQSELADPVDFDVVRSSSEVLARYRDDRVHGPFAKTGWLRAVTEWIGSLASSRGLQSNGTFRQLNASPTFSLIRFETNGPALWFKATGEPNRRELSITRTLAELFPQYLPRILGVHSAWNAWLTVEADGTHLDPDSPIDHWTTACSRLAELQIASIGKSFHLIEAGCSDLRARFLRDQLDPFLQAVGVDLQRGTALSPSALAVTDLGNLAESVLEALTALEAAGIPDTLGHLDISPTNLLVDRRDCVFLDWAEAFVGHPFLTFFYLLEHFRNTTSEPSQEMELVNSYTSAWRLAFEERKIAAALSVAPLLAPFAFAVSLSRRLASDAATQLHSIALLRTLVRRMKREGELLTRKTLCIS